MEGDDASGHPAFVITLQIAGAGRRKRGLGASSGCPPSLKGLTAQFRVRNKVIGEDPTPRQPSSDELPLRHDQLRRMQQCQPM